MAARAKGRALVAKGAIAQRARVSRGIPVGAIVKCADNSGARALRVIQVTGYKGRLRRVPAAGVGDMMTISVRRGTPDMRRKIFQAVLIRQRKPYRRSDGVWVQFEDNAAVVMTPEGDMRGSEIRGPVSREAAEIWTRIASASSIIV